MDPSGKYKSFKKISTLIIIWVLVILINSSQKSYCQGLYSLKVYEVKLKRLSDSIWKQKSDTDKLKMNTAFSAEFEKVLSMDHSFDFPFDSLTGIGRLKSDDGKFRIFTWNIPFSDGTSLYCGFILLNQQESKNFKVIRLEDISQDFNKYSNNILEKGKWFGALYYTIIKVGEGKDAYYTLLGWKGKDKNITTRLIEILKFNEAGEPVFGAQVFNTPEGLKNRFILEYAKNISCVLKWDEQYLKIPRGNQGKYSEKKSWMIVMDHLIPINQQMSGQRKYFVPSGEIYDAFVLTQGKWSLVEDVKVANPTLPAAKKISIPN